MDPWPIFLRQQSLIHRICYIKSPNEVSRAWLRPLVRMHIFIRDHIAVMFGNSILVYSNHAKGSRHRLELGVSILLLLFLVAQYMALLLLRDKELLAQYVQINSNFMFLDLGSGNFKIYAFSFLLFMLFSLLLVLIPVIPREIYSYNILLDIMNYNPWTNNIVRGESVLRDKDLRTRIYLKDAFLLYEYFYVYMFTWVFVLEVGVVGLVSLEVPPNWWHYLIKMALCLTGNLACLVIVKAILTHSGQLFMVTAYYVASFDSLNKRLAVSYGALLKKRNRWLGRGLATPRQSFYRFISEHNAIVQQINSKRDGWRVIMWTVLIFNLPINVIWLRTMMDSSESASYNTKVLLLFSFLGQMSAMFFIVYCFALIKDYGVRAQKTIERLLYQPTTRSRGGFTVLDMLKVQAYRARLVESNIGIPLVDPRVAIDLRAFIEVFSVYICFNLMAIKDLDSWVDALSKQTSP